MLNIEIGKPKAIQLSDWEEDQLSKEQVLYVLPTTKHHAQYTCVVIVGMRRPMRG